MSDKEFKVFLVPVWMYTFHIYKIFNIKNILKILVVMSIKYE